jgi:hypothetical protein
MTLPLSGLSLGNGWSITSWKPDSSNHLHRCSSKMVSSVVVFVFLYSNVALALTILLQFRFDKHRTLVKSVVTF